MSGDKLTTYPRIPRRSGIGVMELVTMLAAICLLVLVAFAAGKADGTKEAKEANARAAQAITQAKTSAALAEKLASEADGWKQVAVEASDTIEVLRDDLADAQERATQADKRAQRLEVQLGALRRSQAVRASVREVSSSGGGWHKAGASWYGPGFYGHTMAGGGTLTKTSMIVAHRTLPFGTRVQFRANGKICTATVKDRGPFVAGRVWDLGPGVAAALDHFYTGVIEYRVL